MPEEKGCIKWNAHVRTGIVFLVLALIVLLAVLNFSLVRDPLKNIFTRKTSLEKGIQEISENYLSDGFTGKEQALAINGLFARVSGRRVYNEVTLLSNGMLASEAVPIVSAKINAKERTLKAIRSFLEMVGKEDIPFLYIQRPTKDVTDENLLPAGTRISLNERAEDWYAEMEKGGAATLNLMPYLSATTEDLERTFYRTDHHWNSDGALEGYGYILKSMQDVLQQPLDMTSADPDNWERHEKENWWIGSYGKRVGPLFAGMDSLIWHTPKFEVTRMSRAYLDSHRFFSGDFEDACIRTSCYTTQGLYTMNNYYVYIGGDGTLTQFRNEYAPNPQKVLIIKNSFAIPVLAFLATGFQQVDAIDLRNYEDSTLAQYIDWTQPDIILMLDAANNLEKKCVTADPDGSKLAEWKQAHQSPETVLSEDIRTIEAEDKNRNAVTLLQLEPGAVYHLDIDKVSLDEGDTEGFSALLCKEGEKSYTKGTIFDLGFCNSHDGFHWVFQVPEDTKHNYELRLCAGIYSHTNNIGLTFSGITVTKE